METPNKLQDCEIVPDKVIIYGSDCIGSDKYKRFAMISITHSHGTNTSIQFEGKGFCDVIITREQAELLIEKLTELIK